MCHYIVMWIKWRYYERKGVGARDGEKKYKVQPILMLTFRPKKATVIRQLKDMFDLDEDEAKEMYAQDKGVFQAPRQKQFHRFPPFMSCDYVYLYNPNYIENRVIYWWILDRWHGKYKDDPESNKMLDKIFDEIDTVLPRPDEKSLSILRKAYKNGMPMHIQIKKHQMVGEHISV